MQTAAKTTLDKEDEEIQSHMEDISMLMNRYNNVYLRVFWERVPKYALACLVYASLYIVIGCISGYHKTLHIIMQSEHASMKELKNFTYVNYPKLLKIIVAPFIDKYYFHAFGRSRTYIALSGVATVFVFVIMALYVDDLLIDRQFNTVTLMFFIAEIAFLFLHLGANTWILTLFKKEQRSSASFLKSIGTHIGEFLCYNMFVPLNSTKWVNTYLLSETNKTNTPLVTHAMLCLFIASLTLICLIVIVFFISEKKIMGDRQIHLLEVFKTMPEIVTRKNSLILLGFIFGMNFLENMIKEVVAYKKFDLGVNKNTVVAIDTAMFPVSLAVGFLCHKFMHKGYLLIIATVMSLGKVAEGLSKFFMLDYIQDDNDPNGSTVVIWMFLNHLFKSLLVASDCLHAYINTIVDVRVGSTMLTIFTLFINIISVFPKTIGLSLAPHFEFRSLVLSSHLLEIIVLVGLLFVARYLDKLDSWDYYTYISKDEKEVLIEIHNSRRETRNVDPMHKELLNASVKNSNNPSSLDGYLKHMEKNFNLKQQSMMNPYATSQNNHSVDGIVDITESKLKKR